MQSTPTYVRERPGWALKLFFKAPVLLYRGWLAELFRARCVMLLTTIGRRTGHLRTNGVSFMPLDDRYVVFAGWGVHADWYQNLLAEPEVGIQVGRTRRRATARPVQEAARRRELMLQMRARSASCGPPGLVRRLLAAVSLFDYDRELDQAVEQAEALPVVEIVPHDAAETRGRPG